jgi:hypothetical protein
LIGKGYPPKIKRVENLPFLVEFPMKASIYSGLPIVDYRRVPVFFMSKLAHGYPGYHEASQPHRNCKSGACQHSVAQNEYSRVERALFKCDGTFANIK